jgi:predicted RNA binding protein YcfA (HicA-like mRNA interferase family)
MFVLGREQQGLSKRRASVKLPVVKPKILIRALKRSGFIVHHTTGSHYFLKKDKLRVSVPYHNKDLKPGTLASIIAQAGLKVEEFVDLL